MDAINRDVSIGNDTISSLNVSNRMNDSINRYSNQSGTPVTARVPATALRPATAVFDLFQNYISFLEGGSEGKGYCRRRSRKEYGAPLMFGLTVIISNISECERNIFALKRIFASCLIRFFALKNY
jgi:hypothetical protein